MLRKAWIPLLAALTLGGCSGALLIDEDRIGNGGDRFGGGDGFAGGDPRGGGDVFIENCSTQCLTCGPGCQAACPIQCPGGDSPSGGDGPGGGGDSPGGGDVPPPGDFGLCGGSLCDSTEECVNGQCLPICEGVRCTVSNACCTGGKECVFDRFCQDPCPNATDERCGGVGDLCCDTRPLPTGLEQTCGSSLTCVRDCSPTEVLCGDGNPGSFGTTCCDGNTEVCVFDECRPIGISCESFVDCAADEYCELVLNNPPGCETTDTCEDQGFCLPDDAPPGTEQCQGRPTDLFEPEFEWHWLGVEQEAGCMAGDNCTGQPCSSYGGGCFHNIIASPVVADMDLVDEPELIWKSPTSGKTITFPAGRYPEVVIKPYEGNSLSNHRLIILDGRTGETKILIGGSTGGYGNPTIGNVDSDPRLEIVSLEGTGIAVYDPFYDASAGDVQTVWGQSMGNLNNDFRGGAPFLTDLNADGISEIIVHAVVVDGPTGTILQDMGAPTAWNHQNAAMPVVADIDLDAIPEVIVGNVAYEVTESATVWSSSTDWTSSAIGGGWSGVGNFVDNTVAPWNLAPSGVDQDYPEVVIVRSGDVAIINGSDGTLMQGPDGVTDLDFDLFTGNGGPPNIADFDGDARVEVSFAGTGCMVVVDVDCAVAPSVRAGLPDLPGCTENPTHPVCVTCLATPGDPICTTCATNPELEPACQGPLPPGCEVDPDDIPRCTEGVGNRITDMVGVLWMDATQDASSAVTGTSVFDFQGDGKSEVLYNDECYFRVYDGETGDVLMERPNSSRTATEYPIVVDVDGDRNSEILVAGNHDQINRDCCAGAPTATCTQNRPANSGTQHMSYYRSSDPMSPEYLPNLALYEPDFCVCGHLTTQASCDSRSGCAWRADQMQCAIYDCASLGMPECDQMTGCEWTGTCDPLDCTAFTDATACRDERPCDWDGANCFNLPDRPDDPADICTDGSWGVWSLGDTQDRWVQTLPIWHQHAYHVTEVDSAGNPLPDWSPNLNNWEVYNNLRQNVQGFAPLNAPDLQIFDFVASLANCPSVLLNARVVNRGRAGIAAGVPIAFYRDTPSGPELINTVPLPVALLPGQGIDITTTYNPSGAEPPLGYDFAVIANPPDGSEPAFECLSDNNEATLTGVMCIQAG